MTSNQISPEAVARREASRVGGKFGEQAHSAPDADVLGGDEPATPHVMEQLQDVKRFDLARYAGDPVTITDIRHEAENFKVFVDYDGASSSDEIILDPEADPDDPRDQLTAWYANSDQGDRVRAQIASGGFAAAVRDGVDPSRFEEDHARMGVVLAAVDDDDQRTTAAEYLMEVKQAAVVQSNPNNRDKAIKEWVAAADEWVGFWENECRAQPDDIPARYRLEHARSETRPSVAYAMENLEASPSWDRKRREALLELAKAADRPR